MKITKLLFLAFLTLGVVSSVTAKTMRATDLNNRLIAEIISGTEKEYVVEFREGDLIPLSFEAKGDLFDSSSNLNNMITIKKDFFIKTSQDSMLVSFDGNTYISLKDAIKGNLNVGSDMNQGQIPGLIKVLLEVYLK